MNIHTLALSNKQIGQVASLGGVETSFVGLQGNVVETELDKHWKPNTKVRLRHCLKILLKY